MGIEEPDGSNFRVRDATEEIDKDFLGAQGVRFEKFSLITRPRHRDTTREQVQYTLDGLEATLVEHADQHADRYGCHATENVVDWLRVVKFDLLVDEV